MLDILRSLSPTALNDSMEKDQSGRSIASAFHNFLKGKRILIILDHVSDPDFLHEMWEAAAEDCPHVKYLVTSQLPNLCNNLMADTIPIAMADTTKDEAMRILASLVGLEPIVIHDDLEEVIVDMIEATEGNPLALACLAGHFAYTEDKTSEQAWWEASDNLPKLLNDQEGKIVLGPDYKSPRRSLWQAMELCMKSLETREAKAIFFLIYACHGCSVPHEILRIWYEFINTSSCTFSKARGELRSRELVKLSRGGLKTYLEGRAPDHRLAKYGVWSLRSLVKLYMEHLTQGKNEVMKEEMMNNNIMCAMDSFQNDSPGSNFEDNSASAEREKAKVAIALCALYFDRSHADRVVIDVAMRARSASNVKDCNFVDQRREAIEPIIWLLGQPKHGKWTERGLRNARKVFLMYICERQLDGDGFAALLKLDAFPSAQLATLKTLLLIFTIEKTPLPWHNAGSTLKALLALLDSKARYSTSVQEAASKAVVPMLEILLGFMYQHDQPDLRLQAALALYVLAFGDKESIGKKIVKQDGDVASLVKSWSQHGKGELHERVLEALNDFSSATDHSIRTKIANEEGVVAGLVKALSERELPGLQEAAALTLVKLTYLNDDLIRFAIVDEEGALAALVKALTEHKDGKLQKLAAQTWRNLANTKDNCIQSKIANEKGAIVGLIKSLSIQDKPDLQEEAIAALTSLACYYGPARVAITNEAGVLAVLVKLLSEHDNGAVPQFTASVFGALVAGAGDDDSIKSQILKEEGAIVGLVKSLSAQDKPVLQNNAAGALANLARNNDLLTQAIANEATAVSDLVKLSSEQNKGDSREVAARALRNLASSTDDMIKIKIGCEDGALASLAEGLSEQHKPNLAEHAAATLWNLAVTKDNTLKLKIKTENGLLTGLFSLSKLDNPLLQNLAKGALKALGEFKVENEVRIVEPGQDLIVPKKCDFLEQVKAMVKESTMERRQADRLK